MISAGPLEGLHIVEVSSFVAAPLAGMLFSQLGAEVIRIDRIGGGPDYRRWPLADDGTSLYWTGLNKGKRSVELDVRSASGERVLGRLLSEAGTGGGILLTNAPASAGTDYRTLRRYRTDLIELRIVGGSEGEPAVDYTVNAASGIASVTGSPDAARPVNHVLPAWDVICGFNAVVALLAALRHREQSGGGQEIHLSLQDVAMAMTSHLGFYAEAELGTDRPRLGNYVYGTYGIDFATRDGGRVMLVALTPTHWRDLLDRTGMTEVIKQLEHALDADFAAEAQRYTHREMITKLLEPWFAARDTDSVCAQFRSASFPWSEYRTFVNVVSRERERLLAGDVFDEITQPGVGRIMAARFAATMSATPPPVARPAPVLGADTRWALTERGGLADDELTSLVEQHVIPMV